MTSQNVSRAPSLCPVVGIGASAGGLVALEQFLSGVPPNCGVAFVVIQHMDPHREGMLVELLRRRTAMAVHEVTDSMAPAPNHVFVIPPGRDLSIAQGVLHLQEPSEPRGLRLPIDFFFKSLAQDRQQNSIGVVLSGMGSDGTLGLRAIREAAGACFVQSPASAQFDSMPRSAIDAGVADVVAPADELPAKIVAYVARVQVGAVAETEFENEFETVQKDADLLDTVIALLRIHTEHDFSQYKKSTIFRRVERRMGQHQLLRLSDYVRYLRENPSEAQLLFGELLIGVTSFFRDSEMWDTLKTEVIPALLASHPEGAMLRAWTPGCSTGEEAYSLAMVFKEALEDAKPAHRYGLHIFASDLDKGAIAIGRAGLYARNIEAEVSPQRIKRFFVDDTAGFRVCREIREMVTFAEQNITLDPPFTKIHLLSCRNLLIYLETELQDKLMQLFHYSLMPDGFLVLGSAESVGSATALFAPFAAKSRIFSRLDAPVHGMLVDFPAAFARTAARMSATEPTVPENVVTEPNLQFLVEKLLLAQHTPAAVLVSHQGNVLFFSGRTGRYLEPAVGRPTVNLFAMVRAGLDQALSEAFHRAMREQTVTQLRNIKLTHEGFDHYVHLVVQPLHRPVGLRGMVLVVFHDVEAPRRRKRGVPADERLADSAQLDMMVQELQQLREEATSNREEMQTSQEELTATNEELQTSNEELQSANEELQSTNEELTTSKEEVQSTNEELRTVNHELQTRLTELSRASNDMKNLLESTEFAILFLDAQLNVRRFTAPTTRIISLISGDLGRPITHIASQLQYPGLADDAREVMRTLVFKECDVPTAQGQWFRVRIMPYRTRDNRIEGLVITFVDVGASKALEAELSATRAELAALRELQANPGIP